MVLPTFAVLLIAAFAPLVSTADAATPAVPGATAHSSGVLRHVEFDGASLGGYRPGGEWGDHRGGGGGKMSVVQDGSRQVLRAFYPKGAEGVGNGRGGGDWKVELGRDYDELYASYRLRFSPGFPFRLGGKLPGLIGGPETVTGGNVPDGTDGFSARGMWRKGGDAVQYTYHMDQSGSWGEDLEWDDGPGGQFRFEPDRWYTIEHRVKMNTPGEDDGEVEAWVDGTLVLREEGLRFRSTDSWGIDRFYFSSFIGGGAGNELYAHDIDSWIDYDRFIISESRITGDK